MKSVKSTSFSQENGRTRAITRQNDVQRATTQIPDRRKYKGGATPLSRLAEDLIQAILSKDNPQQLMDSLNNRIPKSVYYIESDQTFAKWLSRHEPLIENKGKTLDESAKEQLILSKLDSREYDRLVAYLLPSIPEKESWKYVIETVKLLFSQTTSLFRRRFRFLQTKRDGLEINDLVGLINTRAEAAELHELTPENLRCLALVNALDAPEDLELRTRALKKLDEKDITPKSLAAELLSYIQLKEDATNGNEASSHINHPRKEIKITNSTNSERTPVSVLSLRWKSLEQRVQALEDEIPQLQQNRSQSFGMQNQSPGRESKPAPNLIAESQPHLEISKDKLSKCEAGPRHGSGWHPDPEKSLEQPREAKVKKLRHQAHSSRWLTSANLGDLRLQRRAERNNGSSWLSCCTGVVLCRVS